MRDCSDTICVQYSAGYAGEFFSHLLHRSLNPSSRLQIEKNIHSKYEWVNDASGSFYFKHIKRVLLEYNCYKNNKTTNFGFTDWESKNGYNIESTVQILYDDDEDAFIENYVELLRSSYRVKPVDCRYQVYCFNHIADDPRICPSLVFPNSTSLFLYAADPRHRLYFKILELIKNYLTYDGVKKSLDLREYIKSYNIRYSPTAATKVIDIGEFVFGEDASTAESQLSSALNIPVSLNKTMINGYRTNNKKLIDDFLSVEDVDTLSIAEAIDRAVQNSIRVMNNERS